MGGVLLSNLSYRTIWNYFVTSHAKGQQDSTRANLKHKADMEVVKIKIKEII